MSRSRSRFCRTGGSTMRRGRAALFALPWLTLLSMALLLRPGPESIAWVLLGLLAVLFFALASRIPVGR